MGLRVWVLGLWFGIQGLQHWLGFRVVAGLGLKDLTWGLCVLAQGYAFEFPTGGPREKKLSLSLSLSLSLQQATEQINMMNRTVDVVCCSPALSVVFAPSSLSLFRQMVARRKVARPTRAQGSEVRVSSVSEAVSLPKLDFSEQ